jgi:hypothetical protein
MKVLIKTAVEDRDGIRHNRQSYCPDVRCHDGQNDYGGFVEGAAHPNEELIRVDRRIWTQAV